MKSSAAALLSPVSALHDPALLISRVLLGVVLIAHGYEKYVQWGLSGTADVFSRLGVPVPALSALYAATVELLGGAALIVGVGTTIVAVLVLFDMVGAAVFSRAITSGIRLLPEQHGWELNGVIFAAAAALLVTGRGKFSIDRLVLRRHQSTHTP